MENKVEHNIPPMSIINTKIRQADKVNVMQTTKSKIKHNRQLVLLPGEQVWSITN